MQQCYCIVNALNMVQLCTPIYTYGTDAVKMLIYCLILISPAHRAGTHASRLINDTLNSSNTYSVRVEIGVKKTKINVFFFPSKIT